MWSSGGNDREHYRLALADEVDDIIASRGNWSGAGQASALYTFMYYLGSSVAGFIAGIAWSAGGWSRVVEFTGALVALGFVISMWLRRTSPLPEHRQP